MALLDRVKERVETDLSDAELQSMIDDIVNEIETRFGTNAAITVEKDGGLSLLSMTRPIDTGETVTITEIEADNTTETVLAANDYRIRNGGRIVERLATGNNGRCAWAPTVRLAYTPVSDAAKREAVVIKLVQLDIEYRGLTSERAGDWQATYPDAAAEREKHLMTLSPRNGLVMA